MQDGLYTNRSSRSDFIKDALKNSASNADNIFVAVAFFTESNLLKEIEHGKRIRLVVRLGFPTSPYALAELLNHKNIEIRYFTDKSFHSKLYIFGDQVALVGSANLTNSAIMTNQEIIVTIPSEDERFQELATLFSEYWEDAKVLNVDTLKEYSDTFNKMARLQNEIEDIEGKVENKIGKVVAKNINRGTKKESQENIFLDSYRKSYQECIGAFDVVRRVYESVGKRKVPEEKIPLRLEIDSFVSFVRDIHAKGESWSTTALISGDSQKDKIKGLVQEWLITPWPYFEDTIVNENYPRIKEAFSSEKSILELSDDDLFEALAVAHSFHDRLRFYPGGLPTLKAAFISKNKREKVRESLAYLIFGKDEVVKRLANLIFNTKYKLNAFGQSNAQEILGWVGNDDIPVINARTTKILRYFGFDVRQLS